MGQPFSIRRREKRVEYVHYKRGKPNDKKPIDDKIIHTE